MNTCWAILFNALSLRGNSEGSSLTWTIRVRSQVLRGFYKEEIGESKHIEALCDLFSCLSSVLFSWIVLVRKDLTLTSFTHCQCFTPFHPVQTFLSPGSFPSVPVLCCDLDAQYLTTTGLPKFSSLLLSMAEISLNVETMFQPSFETQEVNCIQAGKYMLIKRRDNPAIP